MLFREKMDKYCAWCACSVEAGNDRLVCRRKGIVSPNFSCRKFSYDPLKRVPPSPQAPACRKFEEEDFSL